MDSAQQPVDPLAISFSNRYTRWRHRDGIYKAFEKQLPTLNNQVRVLDIACNEGYLIFELKALFDNEYNMYCAGIDINSEYIEIAQQKKNFFKLENCDFSVMDANDLKFEDNYFDIVTCASLIEHMSCPATVLEEIKRVLKTEGIIILTTPNGENGGIPEKTIGLCKKLIRGRQYIPETNNDHGFGELDLGHVSVKNKQEWNNSFLEMGFNVLSVKGTSGLIFGSPKLDKHRILFGIMVIVDVILEYLPFSYWWSIDLMFVLKKE